MDISSKENFADMYTEYSYIAGWFIPPLESLSRMSRKVQVRFLGDKGGVTRLRYPTETDTKPSLTKKFKLKNMEGLVKITSGISNLECNKHIY